MPVCTFFGHSECYGLEEKILESAIEELILKGVDTFYVGNQGCFDSMVLGCLTRLKENHRSISFSVVLAYMPTQNNEHDFYHGNSIYPEGLEMGPPKFAIERRNKWMISKADFCLCYITHSWGGAHKFVLQAKKKGLTVINLGSAEL